MPTKRKRENMFQFHLKCAMTAAVEIEIRILILLQLNGFNYFLSDIKSKRAAASK